jgi:DNA-binding MarR family transcriptional regulator
MPDPNPADFFDLFNEIGIIEQLSRARLEARLPEGLIAPHFTVLNHLTRVADGRTPIDMARAFQTPKTSMTHTLKGLEAHGLIAFRPNPADGRSKTVWLTDKGRTLRAQVIADLVVDFEKMMSEFDVARLFTIIPILTELRKYMDAARDV